MEITNRRSSIVFDPAHAGAVLGRSIYNGPGVYRTTDNGATFAALGDAHHIDSVSVDLSDPLRMTLLAQAATSRSRRSIARRTAARPCRTNVGLHLPAGRTNFRTNALVIDKDIHLVGARATRGGSNGVFRTTDGGQDVDAPHGRFGRLDARSGRPGRDDSLGAHLRQPGSSHSTDQGNSWTQPIKATASSRPLHPIELPDGRISAAGPKDALRSSSADKGESFQPLGAHAAVRRRTGDHVLAVMERSTSSSSTAEEEPHCSRTPSAARDFSLPSAVATAGEAPMREVRRRARLALRAGDRRGGRLSGRGRDRAAARAAAGDRGAHVGRRGGHAHRRRRPTGRGAARSLDESLSKWEGDVIPAFPTDSVRVICAMTTCTYDGEGRNVGFPLPGGRGPERAPPIALHFTSTSCSGPRRARDSSSRPSYPWFEWRRHVPRRPRTRTCVTPTNRRRGGADRFLTRTSEANAFMDWSVARRRGRGLVQRGDRPRPRWPPRRRQPDRPPGRGHVDGHLPHRRDGRRSRAPRLV